MGGSRESARKPGGLTPTTSSWPVEIPAPSGSIISLISLPPPKCAAGGSLWKNFEVVMTLRLWLARSVITLSCDYPEFLVPSGSIISFMLLPPPGRACGLRFLLTSGAATARKPYWQCVLSLLLPCLIFTNREIPLLQSYHELHINCSELLRALSILRLVTFLLHAMNLHL